MKKIEISDSVLYIHQKFCEQLKDDIPNEIYIDQRDIDEIVKKEKEKKVENSKYEYDSRIENMTLNDCLEAHRTIIKFYKKEENYKNFIIGNPDTLQLLMKEIEKLRLYDIFQLMVKLKLKVRVSNAEKAPKYIYSNLLVSKLGYNKFKLASITVDDSISIEKKDIKNMIPKDIEDGKESEWIEYLELLYINLKVRKDTSKNSKELIKCWGAYPFVFSLKLRTCPYCNKQYIEPIYTKTGKMRADMDHFYSKELYPLFSISIYNLVPACKFCNTSLKGTKNFELEDIHPYRDSIDESFKFGFTLEGDRIIIDTQKNPQNESDKKCFKRYNDYFKYKEQYQYHEDLVREFIIKTRMYNDNVIEDLRSRLGIKNLSSTQIKEQIYGYRMDDKDIHRKALSKFSKDILLQLNNKEEKYDKIELTVDERKKLVDKANKL